MNLRTEEWEGRKKNLVLQAADIKTTPHFVPQTGEL